MDLGLLLNQNPLLISIAHSLKSPFTYRYQFDCSKRSSNSDFESCKASIEISVLGKKKKVVHDFRIIYLSPVTALIVCEKLNRKKLIWPIISIPIRYSKVANVWIGEASKKNMLEFFTFNDYEHGFGLLSEFACFSMQVQFSVDNHTMKLSTYWNESKVDDSYYYHHIVQEEEAKEEKHNTDDLE